MTDPLWTPGDLYDWQAIWWQSLLHFWAKELYNKDYSELTEDEQREVCQVASNHSHSTQGGNPNEPNTSLPHPAVSPGAP
jgi:hypothetical protein